MNSNFKMVNCILNPSITDSRKKLNWREQWIKKKDYLEFFFDKNIKGKYEIIDESINYYFSMIELAIYYLKEYDNYYDYNYIQHKIVFDNTFFNKNTIMEDVKERDFSEYLKYLFYNKNYNINDSYKLIDNSRNGFNYDLIVARMIYPSYYIYYLEKVIIENEELDKLVYIVQKSSEYEEYVRLIVDRINKKINKKIISPF